MSAMSKSLLTVLLALLTEPVVGGTPRDAPARQALLARLPDSLTASRELSFCPDNTCIRVRSTHADADLEGWLLAYLFHFGGYYALADWRADIGSPDRIQGYPDTLKGCFTQPDPKACSKAAFDGANIEVGFVRYDEGQMSEGDAWSDPAEEPATN